MVDQQTIAFGHNWSLTENIFDKLDVFPNPGNSSCKLCWSIYLHCIFLEGPIPSIGEIRPPKTW